MSNNFPILSFLLIQSQTSRNEVVKIGLFTPPILVQRKFRPFSSKTEKYLTKNLGTQPTTAGSELNENRSLPEALVLSLPMKSCPIFSSTPRLHSVFPRRDSNVPGLLEKSVSAGGAPLFLPCRFGVHTKSAPTNLFQRTLTPLFSKCISRSGQHGPALGLSSWR